MELKIKLRQFSGIEMAEVIIQSMTERENLLINNTAVNSCIPRYKVFCKNPREAISHLKSLWRCIQVQKIGNHVPHQTISAQVLLNVSLENDPIERLLKQYDQVGVHHQRFAEEEIEEERIEAILSSFSRTDRISQKKNIFHYWESKRETHPELYQLATVLNAVPCTQVSVGRSFSSFSFIYNCLRTRISDDNLENILIVRLNPDIFRKI